MSKSDVDNTLLKRTILLGIMAGMRSMSGPAVMARRAAQQPKGFRGTIFSPLTSSKVAGLATLASVGEIIVDKLPLLPTRTSPLPLAGRSIYGGLAGAAAYTEGKKPVMLGAAIGAVAAIASSHIFYRLRSGIAKLLHLPDLPVALLEDALVVALGRAVVRTYK